MQSLEKVRTLQEQDRLADVDRQTVLLEGELQLPLVYIGTGQLSVLGVGIRGRKGKQSSTTTQLIRKFQFELASTRDGPPCFSVRMRRPSRTSLTFDSIGPVWWQKSMALFAEPHPVP